MAVDDLIYQSLAGDSIQSLRTIVKTRGVNKQLRRGLSRYIQECDSMARTNLIMDERGSFVTGSEGLSLFRKKYSKLGSDIDASIRNDQITTLSGDAVNTANHLRSKVSSLASIVQKCHTPTPSWIVKQASLALQKKVDDFENDIKTLHPDLAEEAKTLQQSTKDYVGTMSAIDGTPIMISFGDNQEDIVLKGPQISNFASAATRDIRTQGLQPILRTLNDLPLTDSNLTLRQSLADAKELTSIIKHTAVDISKNTGESISDRATGRAKKSVIWTVDMERKEYMEMMARHTAAVAGASQPRQIKF